MGYAILAVMFFSFLVKVFDKNNKEAMGEKN